jgi:ribosomal protein S18 acetylase RimI-like enzyme
MMDRLSVKISALINQEKLLTVRTPKFIRSVLHNCGMYVCLDKSDICGFIGRRQIYDNYFEIISLYVMPGKRNRGIARSLIKAAATGNQYFYIASTFQKRIVELLIRNGFRRISLLSLPVGVIFCYLTDRSIRSLMDNFFRHKYYLLIKP